MNEKVTKHPLIVGLEELVQREDRAALAALRRGLTGTEASVYPFVARYFPREPRPKTERAYLLIASLFALHPGLGGVSVGKCLRRVADASGSDSVEKRFVALLEADAEDLGDHLRHAVSLIRAHEVAIDWNDTLKALLGWESESRWVQRRWARDFWTALEHEEVA